MRSTIDQVAFLGPEFLGPEFLGPEFLGPEFGVAKCAVPTNRAGPRQFWRAFLSLSLSLSRYSASLTVMIPLSSKVMW
jgi:hypothetical protein